MYKVIIFLVFCLAFSQAHITKSNSLHLKRAESQATLIDFTVDNVTIAATGSITCLNGSFSQSGEDELSVVITVDSAYFLTSFAIYINSVGAPQYISEEQWGYVPVNSTNGYSFRQCEQKTNSYTFTVKFSTLINVTGSECYDVQIALQLKKFCGAYTNLDAISYSPPGCDVEFELYSPATESYALVVFAQNETIEAWCVKPGYFIEANTPYLGRIISTYDPEVLNSRPGQYVAHPENLDLVNYIFNSEDRYYGMSFANMTGATCNWADVQNAIWEIIDPEIMANNSDLYLPNSTRACVDAIVADARANGEGYIPACPGGKYLVLVVAVSRDCRDNCTQLMDVQVTGFVQGGPCLNFCNLTYCNYPVRANATFCDCGVAPSPSLTSGPSVPSESSTPTNTASRSPQPSRSERPSQSSGPSEQPVCASASSSSAPACPSP